MTVFVFSAYGLWPMLEYELDIIQRHLHNGDIVYYFTCLGKTHFCSAWSNPFTARSLLSKAQCFSCRSRVNNGLNWLENATGQLHTVPYSYPTEFSRTKLPSIISNLFHIVNSSSDEHITKYVECLHPGLHYAAISSLIDVTRNSEISPSHFPNQYLEQVKHSLSKYHLCREMSTRHEPDAIYVYNGRGSYSSVVNYALEKGITCLTYEYPEGSSYEKYWVLKNTSFHDPASMSDVLYDYLSQNKDEIYGNYEKGKQWLLERQKYKFTGGSTTTLGKRLSHLKAQQLPQDTDKRKSIIAYFSSSLHEYATTPQFLASKFATQSEIINAIARDFSEATLIVRLHPNSSKNDTSQILRDLDINKYPNILIVYPSDPIDSHFLIRSATCVVTYGSSIGYEAAFVGKCVVSIGASIYMRFGLDLTVTSFTELRHGIANALFASKQTLFPSIEKRVTNSIIFATVLCYFGIQSKYISRSAYSGGRMIRDGLSKPIRASFIAELLALFARQIEKLSYLPKFRA